MILDRQTLFSNSQAITATANSTDVYDLAVRRRIAQPGVDLEVYLKVMEAFTAAGAGTLTIGLVTADDSALTTNAETLMTTSAIGKASLVVGYEPAKWSVPSGRLRRYLGLIYTVATGPMTAGKVTAGLAFGRDDSFNYPVGTVRSGF